MRTIVEGTTEQAKKRVNEYATRNEFCRIFSNNMDALYTLAFALTADRAAAEEVFVSALKDCHSSSVFRQWAQSWSRLAVIEAAIRLVRPAPSETAVAAEIGVAAEGVNPVAAPVLRMGAFDRFAYVLSVLDRYSIRDCAILLKCRPQEIKRARQRAIEFLAKAGSYLAAPAQPLLRASLTA